MFFGLIVLYFTLHSHVESTDVLTDPSNYGPYDIIIQEYKECKGPKSVNMTRFSIHTTKVGNSVTSFLNVTFFADTTLDEVKFFVYSMKDNAKKGLWNYKYNSPCLNFAVKGFIYKLFKSSDCFIKEGTYLTNWNISEAAQQILGPNFFYGAFYVKSHLLSKKGNILCSLAISTIRKL